MGANNSTCRKSFNCNPLSDYPDTEERGGNIRY